MGWLSNMILGESEDPGKVLYQTSFGDGKRVEARRFQNGSIALYESQNGERQDFVPTEPAIGYDVICFYGKGRIIEIRPAENQVVVRLSSWYLAGRSRVKCVVAMNAVQVVGCKKLYEMTAEEKIEFATSIKTQSAREFNAEDYLAASLTYGRAMDAMNNLQDAMDMSSRGSVGSGHASVSSSGRRREIGTDALLLMITCSNNAAICWKRRKYWDEAEVLASQALDLVASLESKRRLTMYKILNDAGYTDAKMFGEWRVKSYLILTKIAVGRGRQEEVVEIAGMGREVVEFYTNRVYLKAHPKDKASKTILREDDKALRRLQKKAKKVIALAADGILASNPIVSIAEEMKEDSSVESGVQSVVRNALDSSVTDDKVIAVDAAHISSFAVPKMIKGVSLGQPERETAEEKSEAESEVESTKSGRWYTNTRTITGLAVVGGVGLTAAVAMNVVLKKKR